MGLKDEIIGRLQSEVIFIQESKFTDEQFWGYKYTLKSDLLESRSF